MSGEHHSHPHRLGGLNAQLLRRVRLRPAVAPMQVVPQPASSTAVCKVAQEAILGLLVALLLPTGEPSQDARATS
jgi:hypothetical protein